jgi:hypothetical protein
LGNVNRTELKYVGFVAALQVSIYFGVNFTVFTFHEKTILEPPYDDIIALHMPLVIQCTHVCSGVEQTRGNVLFIPCPVEFSEECSPGRSLYAGVCFEALLREVGLGIMYDIDDDMLGTRGRSVV